MKVLAINGSAHKEGNTYHALAAAAEVLEQQGIECEIVHLGGKLIHGCIGCGLCAKNKDERCGAFDDEVNGLIQQMKAADAIILGSPVYYAGVAGTMKALCDRAFYVGGANGGLYRYKPGAALVALRRSGGVAAFDQLNHYFTISEMPVVSSSYWSALHGAKAGEVLEDGEGIHTARTMAANMAWILKLIEAGKGVVDMPVREPKVRTSFIR